MNAWLPQASYPCGNFSDTSSFDCRKSKGSIGHNFLVCIRTENQYQTSFSPFGPHEISVLIELTLGHPRYHLTDVPTQPNSPPDYVFRTDSSNITNLKTKPAVCEFQPNGVSQTTLRAVVFQDRQSSHLCYTSQVISQSRIRVKLNRVFFPR